MPESTFSTLKNESMVRARQQPIDTYDRMAELYEGNLPEEYSKYFPRKDPRMVVNLIKLAWDDLAGETARWPDLRGQQVNNSDTEAKRVAKFERICNSYIKKAEPNGKLFLKHVAWWLVGVGRSVAVVIPSDDGPRMEARDPRDCYPGVKRSVMGQPSELEDLLFVKKVPVGEAVNQGLLTDAPKDAHGNLLDTVEVIEYIDDKRWIVVAENGTPQIAEHNLGVVPGWLFQTLAPNNKAGLSMFEDQVYFMVSISRMFSQKMAIMDRIANPVFWVRGHEGAVKIGPNVLNKLGPNGEMGQMSPPQTVQIDRDISQLTQMSRILNRNPDVRQGEVASKGVYQSAKSLEQLSDSIDNTVSDFWDVVGPGLEKLLGICLMMDEKEYGDKERSISGRMRGATYRDKYVPSVDIDGHYEINVDYGFGQGGYQGFLQHLQAKDAGVMSTKRAMESMPGVSDVDDELRQIELEQMDAAGNALFMQQANQGQLDMRLWAELREQMAKKGLPLAKVMLKYADKLAEQAERATSQGGAEALTAPDGSQEGMPMEDQMGSPPGIPPSALVGA